MCCLSMWKISLWSHWYQWQKYQRMYVSQILFFFGNFISMMGVRKGFQSLWQSTFSPGYIAFWKAHLPWPLLRHPAGLRMGVDSWHVQTKTLYHKICTHHDDVIKMQTFSTLLALCAGNSLVTGEFPSQRPVMCSFDIFFDLCLNKGLSKLWWGWWFEMSLRSLWRQCNDYRSVSGFSFVWFYNQNQFLFTIGQSDLVSYVVIGYRKTVAW